MFKSILKFSLFLFLSLNLFALDNPRSDFMQKDFQITLDWLENRPKSSAKDFFILQFLEDENLSYETAKKAYDMRKGNNGTLDRAFKQKFNEKLSPEDRFCYNASIMELKSSNPRCIALALGSLKKASDLSKTDLNFFISKLDPYPTLKKDLQTIVSNTVFEDLKASGSLRFLRIFFEVSDDYRNKYLNKSINVNFLNELSQSKDFEKFLRYVIYSKDLNNIQKSLDNLNTNINLTPTISFMLGINAINNKDFIKAKDFFNQSYNNSYSRADKDKSLYWLYLSTNDKNFLNELSNSTDINIYSLYAKELLNIKIDNIFHNLNLKNQPTNYDVYDPFLWDEVVEDTKKNLDEIKLQKYYNIFSSKDTEPHMAFILERFEKYKTHYFITPYRDILKNYDLDKQILIYSIARQESRFIPSAISFSSAQGMMQIMPFLSKDIAKELGQSYNIYDQFNPKKNIEFGSYHLDKLNKQFDNNPLFVAYAYNGGAGYTRTQLKKGLFKEKNKFEPFLSMEMISYNETKDYGKKVLTNYYIYNNYLNSENKISLSTILQSLVSPY